MSSPKYLVNRWLNAVSCCKIQQGAMANLLWLRDLAADDVSCPEKSPALEPELSCSGTQDVSVAALRLLLVLSVPCLLPKKAGS